MITLKKSLLKSILITVLLLSFCPVYAQQTEDDQASVEQKPLKQPKQKKLKNDQEAERIKKVFEDIYERNRTLEKSPVWLKEAYSSLKIKRLNDIPKEEFNTYKKYLYNRNIYIIVHPGFYTFFENKSIPPPRETIEGFPLHNMTERFSFEIPSDAVNYKVMQEQGRLLEDFLELFSTEKRLVILLLPRDYKAHLSYGYTQGFDEYARYINGITNMSESVLYMESMAHDNGFMENGDLEMLTTFLKEIDTENILLGGGYLSKCIDNFYESIRTKFKDNEVFFVMELSAISPADMVTDSLNLLTKRGRINFSEVKKYLEISGVTVPNPGEKTKFKRITSYKVYRD